MVKPRKTSSEFTSTLTTLSLWKCSRSHPDNPRAVWSTADQFSGSLRILDRHTGLEHTLLRYPSDCINDRVSRCSALSETSPSTKWIDRLQFLLEVGQSIVGAVRRKTTGDTPKEHPFSFASTQPCSAFRSRWCFFVSCNNHQ